MEHIYSIEPLTPAFIEEARPLIAGYYEEIATLPYPPDPDIERYQAIADKGSLRLHTIRLLDSQLVGFSTFIVSPHLLYKTLLQASHHLVYIRPYHRGHGHTFIVWSLSQLKSEGISIITYAAMPDTPLQKILCKVGFESKDIMYLWRNK